MYAAVCKNTYPAKTVRLGTGCVVCIKTEDSNVCVCMLVVVSGVLCLREVSVCEREICF